MSWIWGVEMECRDESVTLPNRGVFSTGSTQVGESTLHKPLGLMIIGSGTGFGQKKQRYSVSWTPSDRDVKIGHGHFLTWRVASQLWLGV